MFFVSTACLCMTTVFFQNLNVACAVLTSSCVFHVVLCAEFYCILCVRVTSLWFSCGMIACFFFTMLSFHLDCVFIPWHSPHIQLKHWKKHTKRTMCQSLLLEHVAVFTALCWKKATKNQQKLVISSTCATSLRFFYFLVLISPYFPLLPQTMTKQDQCKYKHLTFSTLALFSLIMCVLW